MKRLPLVLAYALLVACGSPTGPQQGTVSFKMDYVSCQYTGTKSITFYIGTIDVGTETMLVSGTSTGYLTKSTRAYTRAGNPVVQARIANYTSAGGALWTLRSSVNVPVSGPVTHTFIC